MSETETLSSTTLFDMQVAPEPTLSVRWGSPFELEAMAGSPPSHPSYAFTDADLVISSVDGTEFHVHSQILKLISGVFRGMLATPRDNSENPNDPIPVTESTDVLATLLDAAYPNFGQERSDLWEAVAKSPDAIVKAAEKYDMPGVICAIRSHIFHEKTALQMLSPIGMYAFAISLGWEEEARIASRKTLGLDLTSPESILELEKINSRSVIRLQELHRKRRDSLFKAIEAVPERKCNCYHGKHTSLNESTAWKAFLYLVCRKMMDPSYADILVSAAFWTEPDCLEIFRVISESHPISHKKRKHGYSTYVTTTAVCISKDVFMAEVKKAIDELPKSI